MEMSQRQRVAADLATWLHSQGAKVICPMPLAPHQQFRFECISSAAEPILQHIESLGHQRPRSCGTAPQFHPRGSFENRPNGLGKVEPHFIAAMISWTAFAMEFPHYYPPRHSGDLAGESRPQHGPDGSKPQPSLPKGADVFALAEKRPRRRRAVT
jgi:hypothetical protein